MGKGYMGKVLFVDLSRKSFKQEDVPDELYENFLSGYGLAARIIWERQKPGIDPLSAGAHLGFASGLLTGTGALFAGRWMVCGKSPLTGGWGDANCGGDFAPAIKQAGYDAIFFKGKSKTPVYLLVDGDRMSLEDATGLWGRDAIETEKILKEKHGKAARVACIGTGGEKMSLISGVVNAGGRIAARSGLGAVMGSKKLKALCLRGEQKVRVHDREEVIRLSRDFRRRIHRDKRVDGMLSGKLVGLMGKVMKKFKTQPAMAGELFKYTLRVWGTSGITAMSAETGDSPVKNWSGAGYVDFPVGTRSYKVSDDSVTRFEVKKYHCYSCPLGCGGICSLPGDIEETHKPEYETLCAFGALLLVDDLLSIFHINEKLNRAGIDSISCGVTIAWAIEAFERGLLTEDDTGGIRLSWGDASAVNKLVDKIIAGEGIGGLLKDGVKKAAERLGKGSDAFAIHAGGQELPMHDPRYDAGYGVAYEVEPTPGRHTIASYTYLDLMALHKKTHRMPKQSKLHGLKDRFGVEGKGRALAIQSSFTDVINGCGLCLFSISIGGDPPVAGWINASTGWNKTFDEYLEIGRRIKTLRQAFNYREGIRPGDMEMTKRARGIPPLDKGPVAGIVPEFQTLDKDYRKAMGWSPETGKPLDSTLKELGIDYLAGEIED
ncbi:MAG: aldehyde ferredoxin oxidoreductase family protein [Deltaproteobacteria bacterium]|nr:aldehyde ferredoxin oxidoreductase family protein [Deltaproteobacteria bacterium]